VLDAVLKQASVQDRRKQSCPQSRTLYHAQYRSYLSENLVNRESWFGLNIFYSKEKDWAWHKTRYSPLQKGKFESLVENVWHLRAAYACTFAIEEECDFLPCSEDEVKWNLEDVARLQGTQQELGIVVLQHHRDVASLVTITCNRHHINILPEIYLRSNEAIPFYFRSSQELLF
jgi:hypothetical protein